MILHFSLIFLASFHCAAVVSSVNDEGLALLSFLQSVENFPRSSLSNWSPLDTNPCSWNGVLCRDGKVFTLNIANKNLSGVISPALGNLTLLHRINLKNNRFTGSLPVKLFNAQWIQSLVLSGNHFSGPVPPEIGNLKNLQTLDLSQNLFNGSIPSLLAQCSKLKTLFLNQNNFEGSFPDGLGTSLSRLQNFNVSCNQLSGSIPGELGNLSSLEGTLDLSRNFFTGSVPENLGNLPVRVNIDLSYNNLTGSIPQNGILAYVGPTAFIGNPLLCGLPLKNLCPTRKPVDNSQSFVHIPPDHSKTGGHSSSCTLIATVTASIAGICLVGGLLSYWYKKPCVPKQGKPIGEKLMIGKDMLCFLNNDLETLSQSLEQCHFVPLDSEVDFDLELLLKASAFLLGKSALGILYKVVLNNGKTVAVRRLGDGGSQRFKEFQSEVEAIGKIKHVNIVRLRAYCWTVDEKLLIYDYVPNGDLATALHGNKQLSFKPLSWHGRLRIMIGIAKGLAFLHEFSPKRYVHGDLKPSNILLGENMEPKISNFGLGRLASIAEEESMRIQLDCVTPPAQNSPYELTPTKSTPSESYYQSPEVSKITKPSQKWDVYSFGVILLEMISGKLPFIQLGSSEMDLVRWIQLCIEVGKPLSDVMDPFLARDLVDKEAEIIAVLHTALACVHKSPDKRPSMRYVSDSLDKMVTFS